MTNRLAFAISSPRREPPPRPAPPPSYYPCPRCGKLVGFRDATLEVLLNVDLHHCTQPQTEHKEP
jgi:hypothetical protein